MNFDKKNSERVQPTEPLTGNRAAAIEALGNIGLPSPAVLAALEQAFIDPHPVIRALAADAMGKLGSKALPLLSSLLVKLDTTNSLAFEYEVEAIGKTCLESDRGHESGSAGTAGSAPHRKGQSKPATAELRG